MQSKFGSTFNRLLEYKCSRARLGYAQIGHRRPPPQTIPAKESAQKGKGLIFIGEGVGICPKTG